MYPGKIFYPIEMKLVIGVEHIEECDILVPHIGGLPIL